MRCAALHVQRIWRGQKSQGNMKKSALKCSMFYLNVAFEKLI